MDEPRIYAPISKIQLIRQAIETDHEDLISAIKVYVWKFGWVEDSNSAEEMVKEVLQNTVVTALQKADTFDPERLVLPWLKGIAINHIRAYRKKRWKGNKHSISISDYTRNQSAVDQLSECEMFDLLEQTVIQDNSQFFNELLTLVNDEDQAVLRMKFEEGLDGENLAARLGIKQGAAKVRLHRAIARLEKAYREVMD